MKKILFFIFTFLSLGISAQTGTGWGNIYFKMNHADSVNFAKGFKISGLTITTTGAQFNYINTLSSNAQTQITAKLAKTDTASMLTPYVNRADTASMLTKYARKASPTFTGVVTIPSPFTLGATSVTTTGAQMNFINTLSSNAQTQIDSMLHKLPLDSLGTVGSAVGFYDPSGDTINPYIPFADRVDIWDALDTVSLGDIFVLLKDSTGNAEGNYMTRQNYHNDPTNEMNLKAIKNFGSSILCFPIGIPYSANTGATLVDTRIYYQLFYLPEPKTLTGVQFQMSTQGAFTGDEFNGVALYSVSGTTYTRVAISANDHTVFENAAAAVVSVAFTSPYAAAAGYYYVALLYNESAHATVPILHGRGSNIALFNNSSDAKEIIGANDPITTPPDNVSAATMGAYIATVPIVVLY